MIRAVTLLTLDAGSVLYNPAQMPREIVLKHTDGELIKTRRSDAGKWQSLRREEFEVNFWEDGKYDSPVTALASLADRQAFGFRLNGEAVNPLLIGESSELPEAIEIEGLDLGGIVIEDEAHLPFAVFTTDEVYYRAFIAEDDDSNSDLESNVSILEKREGPQGDWEEVDHSALTEPSRLVRTIADETDMEAVSGSAQQIEERIDEHQELFKASYSEADDEIRERMAIQNDTAFSPSSPLPRSVDFPSE